MEWTQFKQSSIEEIRRLQPQAVDHFALCDIGGLVAKMRTLGMHNDAARLEQGEPELTAKADAFLKKFEDEIFLGKGHANVDDVVGAIPNVPAFLAGHPQHMRRRHKERNSRGPLVMMLELTGSSGAMDTRHGRGAAMMALARLLTVSRPVEMWIMTTYGERNYMNMLACRMDTTPLDVARAASLLCDNARSANLSATSNVVGRTMGRGSWSYGAQELERGWSGEALKRVVCPGAEVLFIPAAYYSDNMRDPEQWVRDMLKKYGMSAVPRD